MVIFFEWHWTAVDLKSSSGLPMTDEDAGLGALASPLAGYLGKVQERAASLQYCPWCSSKGLTCALRSYCINLQESVTLCTNPECLFPLVSQSLEDVLASLRPVEPAVGNKRKNPLPMEKDDLIKCSPKRLRSTEPDDHSAISINNGQHAAPKAGSEKVNRYHRDFDCPVVETTRWESLNSEDAPDTENTACNESVAPLSCSPSAGHLQSSSEALLTADVEEPLLSPHCGALGVSEAEDHRQKSSHPELLKRRCRVPSNQSGFANEDIYSNEINTPLPQLNEQTARTEQKSQTADITAYANVKSEMEDLSSTSLTESEELVSVPNQLFWKNSDNLCWLNSLLAALVNCKSLKKCKPKDEPHQSSVWQLMRGYEEVSAAFQVHQQAGRGRITRVPNHMLQQANKDLQNLRTSVFNLLQPKLHCKLGQRETPVFAMPLLLKMDSWVEPLFQTNFHWEFKCNECKIVTKERVMKTLPTFTNVMPDWHPLHAVHLAPCNVCRKKNQRRTMILQRVPPVFVLHFVEGLPDNDLRIYSFNFQGKRYSVSIVIQYDQHLKHFVTWVCNSDGSWVEYDDLKHPECKIHQKLPVPAQEIHIVFWEVEGVEQLGVCSPCSTFSESPPSKNEMNLSLSDRTLITDEQLTCSPDKSLFTSHNDTDIVCAFSVSEDNSDIMDTAVITGAETSIGSTTLLDTFEGLSHNDIITLTLVELKADSEMQPANDNGQTKNLNVPNEKEILEATPDSSSTVVSGKLCHGPVVELLTTSNSSDHEFGDGSSRDPTFVPGARRGQGRGTDRGKTIRKQKGKMSTPSKAVTHISPPVSSEDSKIIDNKPPHADARDNTPPIETAQETSPVSSTETSPLSTSQTSFTEPATLDQNSRWTYMLSKHPLNQGQNPTFKPAPTNACTSVAQRKPSPPSHSTPNPVRRQQPPGGLFPKPQLRTEDSNGLPLKAAEMYGAFGAKSSNSTSLLPSPAPITAKSQLPQPIISPHHKSLMTTMVSGISLPEISSSKKNSSQSSKVPPGLSETEALRYKLMKKLKAKKKKLAKLNELLGHQGGTGLRPDSTDLSSPNTVSSSTFDGSTCEDLLSDLISPATTVSNLSPDSTGLLEMLANGQDQLDCGVNAVGAMSQVNTCISEPNPESFLDEFLLQVVAQKPTEMEAEALSALELFI
ncbi:SUMO-specific isopeptidase USPL1 [Mastacembelus armatus]|uniref:Ubiquitin specific peptidase like 1 n=1 Tax=Mastacembelus armatus TaxID=205130 RepID=A0A3Q3M632_9TELE|nr:SUMO-specific isopeptidase USPL1 [Mastacembelus armatus]